MPLPRISVVIPAYNEAAYLPWLLDSIDVARERCRHGADMVEVIVADNASTDRTAEVARARGCHVVSVEKRVIASARNGGAARARGDVLAFIDADSRIHPETLNVIDALLVDGVVGGTTGIRMERMSPGILATYVVMLAFVWTTGMDAGVVFCRRKDFETVGGYCEDMFFAEDIRFLWDLKKLGRTRGQALIRARAAKAITSTRKFDRYGDWHYLANFLRTGYRVLMDRNALHEWGQDYWYRDR